MLQKRISKKRRLQISKLLGRAVVYGNLEEVKFFFQRGAHINYVNNLGQSFLHFNAIEGTKSITKYLIKHGCFVNRRTPTKDTPLHIAVSHGNKNVVRYLIESGAKIRTKNCYGNTPFHNSIRSCGKISIIKILIRNGANIHQANGKGENPIYLAAKSLNYNALKLLIKKGVDVNNTSMYGSALHEVAGYGQESMVKLLLEAGANVNSMDINNCIPVQYAVYTGNFEVIELLMEAGSWIDHQNVIGATILHSAVTCKHRNILDYLLNFNPNTQLKTTDGNTPLHWAAMLNVNGSHASSIKKLLMKNADVNDRNGNGQTPFHYIVHKGDDELVAFSLKCEANVNIRDFDGSTALHYAMYNDNAEVLNLLLQENIDVEPRCFHGLTALHHAAKELRFDYVDELLNFGADIDARDVCSRTPLFYAFVEPLHPEFAEKRLKTIERLLDRGCNLSIPVQQNRLILEIATEKKDIIVSRLLVKYIALAEVCTNTLDEKNHGVIHKYYTNLLYYEHCTQELQRMKNEFVYGRVSYLDLLKGSSDKLTAYARNDYLVESYINKSGAIDFPLYRNMIETRFDKAMARSEILSQAAFVLWDIIKVAYPEHEMYENILKYLNPKDLRLITEDSDVTSD